MLLQGQKAVFTEPLIFTSVRFEDKKHITKEYNKGDEIIPEGYAMNSRDELCAVIEIEGHMYAIPYEKLHCHIQYDQLSEIEIIEWNPKNE